MKRAEEQLALADASMQSNLDWLNDLAFPLFLAYIGIQLTHELAHKAVATANGMNVTFPTLVPSLVTGLTGSITSLKDPPKNKEALLDYAIAGPLTGVAVSIILLFYGLALTATMDAATYATLPGLPLEFLRSSSLGGGIIDAVIPGLLSIPEASSAGVAESINIPLHPLAVAGYFGLLTNAVSLLPVGSKFCLGLFRLCPCFDALPHLMIFACA